MAKRKYRNIDKPKFEKKIKDYFDSCGYVEIIDLEGNKTGKFYYKPPTITGLAYALGFSTLKSLQDYENKEEYADIMKRAKLYVLSQLDESALTNRVNPPYAIWLGKVNYARKEEDAEFEDKSIMVEHYTDAE